MFTASWQNSTPTRDEKIFSKYEGHIDLNYNLIIKMLLSLQCSKLSHFFVMFLCLHVENTAENERHLCEVSRSRVPGRQMSETQNGRSNPGRERCQPGRDGI